MKPEFLDAPLLTIQEVARALRVDDTTVRRWIQHGVLEAVTLPHHGKRQTYRIKREVMDALIMPHVFTPREKASSTLEHR